MVYCKLSIMNPNCWIVTYFRPDFKNSFPITYFILDRSYTGLLLTKRGETLQLNILFVVSYQL